MNWLTNSLVDNLTWKLLSTVSGNTQVSLPDNFYEINAIVKFRANNNMEFGYVYNFAKIQLEDNDRVYCQGFGFNNANNYCQINASKSSISVNGVVQENTSYISTAQLQVYYR